MGPARVIALAAAIVACRRASEPTPDEGGRGDPAWHVQEVPECRFAVELPSRATRDDSPIPGAPDVRSILYKTSGLDRYIAECAILAVPDTRPLAEILPLMIERRRVVYARPDFPPIVDVASWIEPNGQFARYRFAFARGTVIEHRFTINGREVHEVSGTSNESEPSRVNLARVLASYMRR